MEEKVELELNCWNDENLKELIENHEVYGKALIELIQYLYGARDEYTYSTFRYTEDDFTLIA